MSAQRWYPLTPVTAADIDLELAFDLELTLCIHMVEAFERARGLRK